VVIFTERLELVPLPPALLEAIARGDASVAARRLDAKVPEGWTDTIPARLEQLAADPSEQPWLVRAVVLRAPRRVVGNVGFHGPPDAESRVEIGYGIVPSQRRKGYAREAIAGLTDWAFATGEARVCVASVSPRNAASLALVRSLGLGQVGEQIDEVDGLELVFERTLPLEPASGSKKRGRRSQGRSEARALPEVGGAAG
jgi:[ribosomal protein S5]-alanine N-acetyltransferase